MKHTKEVHQAVSRPMVVNARDRSGGRGGEVGRGAGANLGIKKDVGMRLLV